VVEQWRINIHHGDTENTEVAQRLPFGFYPTKSS
jgi:hypothetical protein